MHRARETPRDTCEPVETPRDTCKAVETPPDSCKVVETPSGTCEAVETPWDIGGKTSFFFSSNVCALVMNFYTDLYRELDSCGKL